MPLNYINQLSAKRLLNLYWEITIILSALEYNFDEFDVSPNSALTDNVSFQNPIKYIWIPDISYLHIKTFLLQKEHSLAEDCALQTDATSTVRLQTFILYNI